MPLVFAGLFLSYDIFIENIDQIERLSQLFKWAIALYFFAVVVLAIHHFFSWIRSTNEVWPLFLEWRKSKCQCEYQHQNKETKED